MNSVDAKFNDAKKLLVTDVNTSNKQEFQSLREASRALGFTYRKIVKCACNNITLDNGLKFEFVTTDRAEVIGDISVVDDTEAYNIDADTDEYYWSAKNRQSNVFDTYRVPVKTADTMFFEYSRYGMDMSALEVRIKHNLSIKMWNSMCSRLQLYKESDIFSPVTRNNYTYDEYIHLVDEKQKERQLFKSRTVIDRYNKFQITEAKKTSEIAYNKQFVVSAILDELNTWVIERSTTSVTVSTNKSANTYDELIVAIADLHVGAEVSKRYNNQGFNSDILLSDLLQLSDRINALNAKSVVVLIGGDILHSITGTMHKAAFKQMEQHIIGAKQIKYAVEILETFISSISNVKTVLSVSGNHDRMSDDYKADTNGEMASVVMYCLNRIYSNIEIKHDPFLLTYENKHFNTILFHGNQQVEHKPESLIHDYGVNKKFNLILSADKHSRGKLLDTSKSRHIRIPSMYTGDDHSIRCGYSSTPGILAIYGESELPQVLDLSIRSNVQV
jgi:metallophosphoesterase superfamily enzyme